MGKLQVIMLAFSLYGMLTTGASFICWLNSSAWGDNTSPDVELRNFWKWAFVIVMLVISIAYFSGLSAG